MKRVHQFRNLFMDAPLGHERFATDRKTYYIDCCPENVPASNQLADADLPALLDDFDARQLLHVTFGSALDGYGRDLQTNLLSHEAGYEAALITHFRRHLTPLFDLTLPEVEWWKARIIRKPPGG